MLRIKCNSLLSTYFMVESRKSFVLVMIMIMMTVIITMAAINAYYEHFAKRAII